MRRPRTLLALLSLAVLALAGCATNEDTELTGQSTVPWGRPADWEGQVPGMGGR